MFSVRNNLLPPRKKQLLKKLIRLQFIKSILEILLILTSLITMVFLGAQTILEEHFASLTTNIVSVNNEHTPEIRDIIHINQILHNTNIIQKQFNTWSDTVYNLMSHISNNDIIISRLSLNKSTHTFEITGIARTRDAFLSFQKTLEDSPYIKDVQVPINSLTQPENIAFHITATFE